MKIFPNLAVSLRFYFGLARVLVLVFAVLWVAGLIWAPALHRLFTDDPKLMVSVGDGSLNAEPGAVALRSDAVKAGTLALGNLRGALQIDLMSKDDELTSTLRWSLIPSILVLAVFSWLMFTALLKICTSIGQKEAFTERNLRLVRSLGFILIGYNVVGFAVHLWAARVMNGYFSHHVTVDGIKTTAQFPGGLGALQYTFGAGFPIEGGLVTGFMVLLMAEAFRQGLALKTENDLTI